MVELFQDLDYVTWHRCTFSFGLCEIWGLQKQSTIHSWNKGWNYSGNITFRNFNKMVVIFFKLKKKHSNLTFYVETNQWNTQTVANDYSSSTNFHLITPEWGHGSNLWHILNNERINFNDEFDVLTLTLKRPMEIVNI